MGIKSLFGFGQARDKPVDKAADAGYSFLFGRTTSAEHTEARQHHCHRAVRLGPSN